MSYPRNNRLPKNTPLAKALMTRNVRRQPSALAPATESLLTLAFVLMTVSALPRVSASILAGPTVILITGLTWSAAFVCFMIVIVPVLVRPSANASP